MTRLNCRKRRRNNIERGQIAKKIPFVLLWSSAGGAAAGGVHSQPAAQLLLFNLIVAPLLAQRRVTEIDYGAFIKMTEEGNIGEVKIEDNQIVFTDKENKAIYKTGIMPDSD